MDAATTLRERSALAVRRVEKNDPTLTYLSLREDDGELRSGVGQFSPSNSPELLSRLGDAIGKNTHLQQLSFVVTHNNPLPDTIADNRAFFKGLKCNASIDALFLCGCHLYEGRMLGRKVLNTFAEKNNSNNLTEIKLFCCRIRDGGASVLSSTLPRCKQLQRISINCCNNSGDDMLEDLVLGMRGLHQLASLNLGSNSIRWATCNALSSLLQDHSLNLRDLDIPNNFIDDNCAVVLANSLDGNTKLESICFSRNPMITQFGWGAFSKALCDASSINNTYLSNHTLESLPEEDHLGDNTPRINLPPNLSNLLELNSNSDKKQVAIQKILLHHPHLNMLPFLEWELKVLPIAIRWFDRARECIDNEEETNVDAVKLSSIYQFARAVPLMFVPKTKQASKRRRLGRSSDGTSWLRV